MAEAVENAVRLLKELIAIPSVSRDEARTAERLYRYLAECGARPQRLHNNVWAVAGEYDPALPTLLLNSHHDTVRPSPAWSRDPFTPSVEQGRIYGLGSNDAGASLVCLTEVFLEFCSGFNRPDNSLISSRKPLNRKPLRRKPYNLILALSAEEECSGERGIRALLPEIARQYRVDMAIVGEPTSMQASTAERGLVVLDCTARGRSGHAARNEGVNALYAAVDDIAALRNFRFERESAALGPIGVAVTQIEAGTQHNVIPDSCRFVVDIRTTDAYTNEQTVDILRSLLHSEAVPRSTRIRASVIADDHPLVRAAVAAGCTTFVSPTASDRTLMPFPALKIGPGESSRSHTADEFVCTEEIAAGLEVYRKILNNMDLPDRTADNPPLRTE